MGRREAWGLPVVPEGIRSPEVPRLKQRAKSAGVERERGAEEEGR